MIAQIHQPLFLRNKLLKTIDPDITIQFSQWVSTDRSQLFKEESEFDEKLTQHGYVAKKQAEFFKQLKENLQFEECVIVLDFAENYSFLVQNATQGFLWNNSQAAIYPFTIYYVDGSGKLAHKYCVVDAPSTGSTGRFCCFDKKTLQKIESYFN